MIDFTKLLIKDSQIAKYLLLNLNELFDTTPSTVTTTIGGTQVTNVYAYYKGLRFKITQSGVVVIDGSLHKAMNGGEHNHNDFSYEDLLRVIAELCERFRLNPHQVLIQNLEIGVNVNTPFNPTEFTDRCSFLFTDAGVIKPSPITRNDYHGFDKGIRFELSEYCIKIYNKSKQYNTSENILRVEYKTLKSRAMAKAGIVSLYDLCDPNKLIALMDSYLLPRFSGLMVDEMITTKDLTRRESCHYNKRLNYKTFWVDVSRNQRRLNKGYINAIYHKYASTDFKLIVADLMQRKADQMLVITEEGRRLGMSIANTNYVRNHTLYEGWDRTKLAA